MSAWDPSCFVAPCANGPGRLTRSLLMGTHGVFRYLSVLLFIAISIIHYISNRVLTASGMTQPFKLLVLLPVFQADKHCIRELTCYVRGLFCGCVFLIFGAILDTASNNTSWKYSAHNVDAYLTVFGISYT